MTEAEGLNGYVDVGGLRNMELVLQGADAAVVLQEEAALHARVVPILEQNVILLLNKVIIHSFL